MAAKNSAPGVDAPAVRRVRNAATYEVGVVGRVLHIVRMAYDVARLQVHDDEYTPMRSIPCELLLDSGDVLEDETDDAGWVEAEVPRAKQRIGVSYTSDCPQQAR